MSHIKIHGGHSLHGEIEVQGAKNAALPIIAASVFCTEVSCYSLCFNTKLPR